jgi:chromosome partitioning protein
LGDFWGVEKYYPSYSDNQGVSLVMINSERGKFLFNNVKEKGYVRFKISKNVKLSEAPSYGMPITVYDPKSKGAKCYEKLVKEILKANTQEVRAKHMK